MIKVLLIIVVAIIGTINVANSQTNPKSFNLSTGDYTFTYWDSLAPAKTYPDNMLFRWTYSDMTAPFYNDSASTNYTIAYNLIKGPRFNGLRTHGLSIITTSSSQSGSNEFTGSILLGLNSSGRKNIQVSWKSQTITANPRVMNLRLQYRVDSTMQYTDMPGPVQFISSTTVTSDSTIIGPVTLPSVCENQQYLELRWIYYESDGMSLSVSGKRGNIRVDGINITSTDSADGIIVVDKKSLEMNFAFTIGNGQLSINTSFSENVKVNIYDMVGNLVYSNNVSKQHININNLSKGMYVVSFVNQPSKLIACKKVVID